MPCFRKFLVFPLLAMFALPPRPSFAILMPTYDLSSLCSLSTDVVEARLTRHHLPGQEEWKDTFTATVLNPLQGRLKAGAQVPGLDLTLYDPSQTGQRCILFLTPNTLAVSPPPQSAPLRIVDMLLIDSHNRVRRYFQWSNPGGLVADGFNLSLNPPMTKIKTMREHGSLVFVYQEHNFFVENDAAEQKYQTLAGECLLIASRWAASKKLKAPPYQELRQQVLHQIER